MKRQSDRFIRWQKITIDQLSFVTYLLMTISVATIGFMVNTLLEPTNSDCLCFLLLGLLAIGLHLFSAMYGTRLALNRLDDFRLTSQIARKSEAGKWVDPADRLKTEDLDKRTWKLFRIQWHSFGYATLFAVLFYALLIITKHCCTAPPPITP